MHNPSLIPVKTRDEFELEQLLAEIQAKRRQITEMTLALENLKREVHQFEKAYSSRLAPFYFELDKINLLTKEYRLRLRLLQEGVPGESSEMEARVEACFRTERERLANDARETDRQEEVPAKRPRLPAEQMKQLRTLYWRLAKRHHPDKAQNDVEREKRQQMMILINRAYDHRELHTLERLNVELMPEGKFAGETHHKRKQQLAEEINQLMHTIGDLRLEINRIRSSQIYWLKQDVDKARKNGADLLADLARNLQRKINAGQRRLTGLIDRFHRLKKNW